MISNKRIANENAPFFLESLALRFEDEQCNTLPSLCRSVASGIEIKDRALVVARDVLEELCAFIWEEHENKMMKEHILRARDQVMNARLGKLSSDPFPVCNDQKP